MKPTKKQIISFIENKFNLNFDSEDSISINFNSKNNRKVTYHWFKEDLKDVLKKDNLYKSKNVISLLNIDDIK